MERVSLRERKRERERERGRERENERGRKSMHMCLGACSISVLAGAAGVAGLSISLAPSFFLSFSLSLFC